MCVCYRFTLEIGKRFFSHSPQFQSVARERRKALLAMPHEDSFVQPDPRRPKINPSPNASGVCHPSTSKRRSRQPPKSRPHPERATDAGEEDPMPTEPSTGSKLLKPPIPANNRAIPNPSRNAWPETRSVFCLQTYFLVVATGFWMQG